MQVDIIGVRHHSPACARLVAARIREWRPQWVLIEGPCDFNERLDELFLAHRLPLAIYSYSADEHMRHASWTPFADYSPEWQALQVGREQGATLAFIDLPAWHHALADISNRYADVSDVEHENRAEDYEAQLALRLGIEGSDALWDHLFEDECALPELRQRLDQHFINVRGETAGSFANQAREQMMARWIAWAAPQGRVLVVCGGYHAPALARLWPQLPACGQRPDVEENHGGAFGAAASGDSSSPAAEAETGTEAPGSSRAPVRGSCLVPYTNKRLDALQGYASGMPSPAFQQAVWDRGLIGAGEELLQQVLQRLRSKKQSASTAELLAIHVRCQALAAVRGHCLPLRNDWLDAAAGSLVREALDVPLPWTYRGPLRAGTDPVLVEMMDVLAGEAAGQLDPSTPQPPLVASVDEELRQHGLLPPQPDVRLALLEPAGRRASQILHRLDLLQIPGFRRRSGPDWALSGERAEIWSLSAPLEQRAALIEAAIYGATLLQAACGRLEADLQHLLIGPPAPSALAQLLNRAALAGLADFSTQLLDLLEAAVRKEMHFSELGSVLALCHGLYLHGEELGMAGAPALLRVLQSGMDRALWLCEDHAHIAAAETDAHLATWQAMRQLVRDALACPATPLGALPVARAQAVWMRKARHPAAATLSRGAALGCLISIAAGRGDPVDLQETMLLLELLAPVALGDALQGLLALARHELGDNTEFIVATDRLLCALDNDDFVLALPTLRAAFAWLPPRERGDFAARIATLHGGTALDARGLTAPLSEPLQLAENQRLEQRALARLQQWGLLIAEEGGS